MNSYKVEVVADGSGKWVSNGLRFAVWFNAYEYGANLAVRWTAVRQWRVVQSEDAATHTYDVKTGQAEKI